MYFANVLVYTQLPMTGIRVTLNGWLLHVPAGMQNTCIEFCLATEQTDSVTSVSPFINIL